MKRLLSFLLTILLVIAIFTTTPITASALTQDGAVEWLKTQTNYDNHYQCLAFVQLYTRTFWGWSAYVNPNTYGNSGAKHLNQIPLPNSDWKRFECDINSVQPGDILIFTGGTYGHTGVAIGNGQMVDANNGTDKWGHVHNSGAGNAPGIHSLSTATNFWGVIRPPLDDAAPTLPSTSADIPNGIYALQDKSSKKYVSTGLTNANGHNTYIHEWANNNDQKFTLERQSDNTYKIISRWSGKVLDVRNMETQNGVNITQFDWWVAITRNGILLIADWVGINLLPNILAKRWMSLLSEIPMVQI